MTVRTAWAGSLLLLILVGALFGALGRLGLRELKAARSDRTGSFGDRNGPTGPPGLVEGYGRLPLSFESNQGQTDPQVLFLSRGSGFILFLTAREAVFHLRSAVAAAASDPRVEPLHAAPAGVVRMKLVGSGATPAIKGIDALATQSNYFVGADPSRWRTNVPHYRRVEYESVYPGIDLIYYGKQRQLEYDFVVAPGSDHRTIRIAFEGVERLELDTRGNLVLKSPVGELLFEAPRIYQEIRGVRKEVSGSFVLVGTNQVGFAVQQYDRSRALVIDPSLTYSSFLGGNGADSGADIAVDAAGSAYIVGTSNSTDFPTANPLQAFRGGSQDVFVTKLNPAGSAIVYSTYLGGTGSDEGNEIAVDSAGNTYIAGNARSNNFPTVVPFQAALSGIVDGFVAKLNPAGAALLYSSFIGGSDVEHCYGLAIDPAGNAYLTGETFSTNFPTRNPFQSSKSSGSDAWVVKVNPAGSTLVYSTHLGGSGADVGLAIAADSSGNAYVTGETPSANFPTLSPAFTYKGSTDAFIAKLNVTGSALVYSTFLGGNRGDAGRAIGLDSAGNVYIAGSSDVAATATGFPVTSAFQGSPVSSAGSAGFIGKLNAAGSALIYSTYLDGNGLNDNISGLAVDATGNVFVTGRTDSPTFPLAFPVQTEYRGGATSSTLGDAFVTGYNSSGTIVFSTYLGGSLADSGSGIALDASGAVYVTGGTGSTNFPTASPIQASHATDASRSDAFVAKLNTGPGPGTLLGPIATAAWTRFVRADTNGNGVPDPEDEAVTITRQGNELNFISPRWFSQPIETAIQLSNSVGGRFRTASRVKNSARRTVTRTGIADQVDGNSRVTSISFSEEYVPKIPGRRRFTRQGKVTALDQNGDGTVDSLNLVFDGVEISTSLATFDVNADGKADFVSIPWTGATLIGVNSLDATPDPQVFLPLGDTNADGTPDAPAFDFDNNGVADADLPLAPVVMGTASPAIAQKLFFAQFADGSPDKIFSQILLFNLDPRGVATVRILLRNDQGGPLTVDLNGVVVTGETTVTIPIAGLRILKTDGIGDVLSGSVTVLSDRALAGVIVFGGGFGLSGVGSSQALAGGFVAPVETNTAEGTSTGFAVMNLEAADLTVNLELLGMENNPVATASEVLASNGHLARFLPEIKWVPGVDFTNFNGLIRATTSGRLGATVLQFRPGEFATMPVASRSSVIAPSVNLDQLLRFAQFVDGAGIFSQLILYNLDTTGTANVQVVLKNDAGAPLSVDLNGTVVNGQTDLTIPAGGLRILKTDGVGTLVTGSAAVSSNRTLAGVILFGGAGVAGVGSSQNSSRGFAAPFEIRINEGISTGVALMDLSGRAITVNVVQITPEGAFGSLATISLTANGHLARFLHELTWTPPLNFDNLNGTFLLSGNGPFTATVLQIRPGQFATLPAAKPGFPW